MRTGLLVLGLFLAFSGSLVLGATEVSEGSGETQTISEDVWAVSYRTSSGTHLIFSESSKTAYPVVELYLYGNGAATVVLDGVTSSVPVSGLVKVSYSFDAGSSHTLSVVLGSISKDYSFKISQSISIKEIDPDSDEVISMFESEYNNQKLLAALIAFVSTAVGIYAAFRIARWRAANGVDSL